MLSPIASKQVTIEEAGYVEVNFLQALLVEKAIVKEITFITEFTTDNPQDYRTMNMKWLRPIWAGALYCWISMGSSGGKSNMQGTDQDNV